MVNRLAFGAMRITGEGIWGEPRDPDEARRVLRRAVELGVDFIDTAHSYGPETSERLIGESLRREDGVTVATKSGYQRPGPGSWTPDGRPETLRRECERSIELLRVDRIPLFQLHCVDPNVPLEESVGALADLRNEGKIALVGLSNVTADELDRAQAVTPIASVQNRYSLGDRPDDAVLKACERAGLAFIPWFPLAAGDLARDGRLRSVADTLAATPAQVALAWLLRRSPSMLPIPGTSSVAHLEENVAAAGLELSDAQFEALAA